MNADERFDRLIKASLTWQADQVARKQPSAEHALQRLATRLGPPPTLLRPQVVLRGAAPSMAGLLLLLVLLIVLLVSVLVVGSQLLRLPPPQPLPAAGQFGHGTECHVGLREGVAFELGIEFSGMDYTGTGEDRNITLWQSGSLVVNDWTAAETRADTIRQTQIPERRLTRHGVDLLLDRILDAGLTPGCRSLRTGQAGGRISALSEEGYVEVFWGPNVTSRPLARLLTQDEEAELTALAEDLANPESWLPDDAWLDARERRVRPVRWLVFVGLRPTEHAPGNEVDLLNGDTLRGSDPRYERVVLPGGVGLAAFGTEFRFPRVGALDLSAARCGLLESADALAFAESLDSLSLGTDRDWENGLFTADLSVELQPSIQAAFPAGYDCDAHIETMLRTLGPAATAAPPAGEFAALDPCTFVPAIVAEEILLTDAQAVHASRLPIGVPAQACVLSDSADEDPEFVDPFMDPYYGAAMVTLHPWRVSREDAQEIALGMFGAETVEDTIAGRPAWFNACYTRSNMPQAGSDCPAAVVVWTPPYLVAFEFTENTAPWNPEEPDVMPPPRVTDEMKRQFIEAVVSKER